MTTVKRWIMGNEYEFPEDWEKVADLIQDGQKRAAPNDLAGIGFTLLDVIVALTYKPDYDLEGESQLRGMGEG